MQNFTYYSPTEIIFGKDTENEVGALCKKYGATKVFIVYGSKSAVESGLLGRVKKSIADSGLDCEAKGGVVANPLLSKAIELTEDAKNYGADFILAVGGGSAIDTAKAVAHSLANPGEDIWDYCMGKTKVKKTTPFGTIVTLSATGSETSDSAVLTNDLLESPIKKGITTDFNRGRFAIMNPELTMTLPKYHIGAGAADILMHTVERFFATTFGNHLTDEFASGLCRTVIKYGPIAVEKPDDYEAQSELMWCGSLSHIGLTGLGAKGKTNKEGDWSCHQMGMALSAIYDATHGASLTAIWGTWARYVREENISRFADYAKMVFGIECDNPMEASEKAIVETENFFKKLDMPITLTELIGHTPSTEEINALASKCSYENTRTIGAFKVLNEEDMRNIYTKSI